MPGFLGCSIQGMPTVTGVSLNAMSEHFQLSEYAGCKSGACVPCKL